MSDLKSHGDNLSATAGSPERGEAGGHGVTRQPPEPENAISLADVEATYAAYVRYLSYEDGEFRQGGLVEVGGSVPENAIAVTTGIYFVTPEQEDRIHWGTPKAKLGRQVPTKIQNECNADGRVAYAIVAESDALEDGEEVQTIIDSLSTFAEDWIGVDEYSFYYSGNRSIHLHTQKFVPADGIDDLRRLAETFNAVNGTSLDTSIYKENAQFRIVGAKHRTTGLYKIPITADADRADCIRAARHPPEQRAWPFELPAPRHRSELAPRLEARSPLSRSPHSHYRPGIADINSLPPEIERQSLRGVYKGENASCVGSSPDSTGYARPFSPYKKTGDETDRSVIVMEQVDGLRQNRWTRDIYVPAQIQYAVGGGDGSFTRSNSKSLVKLSPRDARKWNFEAGDMVIIIGGNSGSSRLFAVEDITASLVATALESKGRGKAFEILANRGFGVGSAGYNPSRFHDDRQPKGESEAARIKRGIENETHERNYTNLVRVVCRLLRIDGWDAAYSWCQDIFGPDFDAEETHERLESIVEAYDDYDHVSIPTAPERESS